MITSPIHKPSNSPCVEVGAIPPLHLPDEVISLLDSYILNTSGLIVEISDNKNIILNTLDILPKDKTILVSIFGSSSNSYTHLRTDPFSYLKKTKNISILILNLEKTSSIDTLLILSTIIEETKNGLLIIRNAFSLENTEALKNVSFLKKKLKIFYSNENTQYLGATL